MRDDRRVFIRAELQQLKARQARVDRWSWRMMWLGTFVVAGAIYLWVYGWPG